MQRTHSKPEAREKENSNQPYPLKRYFPTTASNSVQVELCV